MKQFLSLSFMFFLLLVLPGCMCKKECHSKTAKQKKEKKQNQRNQHHNKKQSNYEEDQIMLDDQEYQISVDDLG